MKERLVEDWLIRINERGYEVPFCQSLLAKGFRILRSGHSPTEHGKDVLAIAPDGDVCGYQLKTGDFGQAEINKYHEQLNMLVEARPVHPGLPLSFDYRPFLVTTGEFRQPAVSFVNELNSGWRHRNLPPLSLINGRQLHVDFVSLSSDFWPIEPPAVRRFRELYLVDGRGDLDLPKYAAFLFEVLNCTKGTPDLERRIAAANVFASYLLSEFYKQEDHWSIFQGWTVCASQIAWAGESTGSGAAHWRPGFDVAKRAGLLALESLAAEVARDGSFRVRDREFDDLTRTRNAVALAGAAGWQLIENSGKAPSDNLRRVADFTRDLLNGRRLLFWGEGAFSQFLCLIWLLERADHANTARELLVELVDAVAARNSRESDDPMEDPYTSSDESLTSLLAKGRGSRSPRRRAVESYALFPLVLLAVRRDLRPELEKAWKKISYVHLSWFRPEIPCDALQWHCPKGKEYQDAFEQPQSWTVLREIAFRDDRDRLPQVLRDDTGFGLMFMLAFPHRLLASLVKRLDSVLASDASEAPNP